MIWTLCGREFGLGFGLDETALEEVLVKVNKKREDEHYLSAYSALDLQKGETKKPKLTSDPCYLEFKYGKNRDGY